MDCAFYTNDCERFDCCECELNEERRIKMTTLEKIKEEIFEKSVQMHFDGNYYIKVATVAMDEETNKPIIKDSDVFDIIDKYVKQEPKSVCDLCRFDYMDGVCGDCLAMTKAEWER